MKPKVECNHEYLARIFRALSNENRLAIFDHIRSSWGCEQTNTLGTTTSKHLARDTNLASSTISHHIKKLRRVGLVRGQRKGQVMLLSAANESITTVIAYLKGWQNLKRDL